MSLLVVRETNGKPVKNAEVVVHLVENGKQKQEGLELKTHDDGKAEATGLPYGKVRIQVIAHDDGPGIADLDQALRDGFSTSGSLGVGLPGVRRLVDEFHIDSQRDRGTTVTITKWKT